MRRSAAAPLYVAALLASACSTVTRAPQASAYRREPGRLSVRYGQPLAGHGEGSVDAFPTGNVQSFPFELDDVDGWIFELDFDLSPHFWGYGGVGDRVYRAHGSPSFFVQRTRDYHGGIRWSPLASTVQPYLQFGGRTTSIETFAGDRYSVLPAGGEKQSGLDFGAGLRLRLLDRFSIDANLTQTLVVDDADSLTGHQREVEAVVFAVTVGLIF